jgi:anti-anti-sigma factor
VSLRVEVHRGPAPPGAWVRAAGEVDLATVPILQAELDALLSTGYCHVDLDLGEVAFCDVVGLNMLLRVHAAVAAVGGRLTLHHPCPTLRTMLRVLRLERAFEPIPRNGRRAGDEA